jgi:hypothetical protein
MPGWALIVNDRSQSSAGVEVRDAALRSDAGQPHRKAALVAVAPGDRMEPDVGQHDLVALFLSVPVQIRIVGAA